MRNMANLRSRAIEVSGAGARYQVACVPEPLKKFGYDFDTPLEERFQEGYRDTALAKRRDQLTAATITNSTR